MAAAASARAGRVPLAVAALIGLAWIVAVAAEAGGLSSSLHHDALFGGGLPSAGGFAAFGGAWAVMIAAMMLPSALPLVRLFAAASARQPRPGAAMAAFLAGYALVWAGFALGAALGDVAMHRLVESTVWLRETEWAIGGAVLALAGAFQFTPLKDACLDRCRHPGHFLIRYYERGIAGGFRVGARHGLFCVGCCWALMLVMFAVGVASLVWMALLTAVMVHEKTRPAGRRAVPVTGVALLGLASVVTLLSAYGAGAI